MLKPKILIIAFILVLLVVGGCYSQEFRDASDSVNNEVAQETEIVKNEDLVESTEEIIESSINREQLFEDLQSLPTSRDSNLIYITLEKTYYYLNQINSQMLEFSEKMKVSEISKQEFCGVTNSNYDEVSEIKKSLGESSLSSDIILSKELTYLKRGPILSNANLLHKRLELSKIYCEEDSILKLTQSLEGYESANSDFKTKDYVSEPNEFSGTLSWDQTFHIKSREIKEKLSSSSESAGESTSYTVGDTITKGGLKVTLNSVDKKYLSWENSYNKNDPTWSNEEWNEILAYKSQIGTESDNSMRQALIDELNNKFGDRVGEDYKWWYFDVDVELIDDNEKTKGHYNKFRNHNYNLMELYNIETEKIFNEYEYLYYSTYEGRGLFQRDDSKTKIKLLISFDNCGKTKADIEAVQKEQICDNTYVFGVDLGEI